MYEVAYRADPIQTTDKCEMATGVDTSGRAPRITTCDNVAEFLLTIRMSNRTMVPALCCGSCCKRYQERNVEKKAHVPTDMMTYPQIGR